MSKTQEEQSDSRARTEENFFHTSDPKNAMKEWADEATKFVQRNPWVAIAAAAAVGYWLGSIGNRPRPRTEEHR